MRYTLFQSGYAYDADMYAYDAACLAVIDDALSTDGWHTVTGPV